MSLKEKYTDLTHQSLFAGQEQIMTVCDVSFIKRVVTLKTKVWVEFEEMEPTKLRLAAWGYISRYFTL